jgi:hypothetical protein
MGSSKTRTPSQWFSLGTPVSSSNKTDRHDITKILLKVTLNTIALAYSNYSESELLKQINMYKWYNFSP